MGSCILVPGVKTELKALGVNTVQLLLRPMANTYTRSSLGNESHSILWNSPIRRVLRR